jgi:catechol 2,3-dioxygenase-like lactoylglutathione lyase family enzyme
MSPFDSPFVILYVSDLEAATSFYRDIMGLSLTYSSRGWVQFGASGTGLVLHPKRVEEEDSAAGSNAAHLAFVVQDLAAEYERLSERRVRFKAPPASAAFGKHATCIDLEGNEIDLLEWNPPPNEVATSNTVVNDIIAKHPETMDVFENHGIRICGGCLVLLNSPVYETAEYSGLDPKESAVLLAELNEKLAILSEHSFASAK